MKHRRSNARQSGFSLLELMIVVAIIMVIAAMAMPKTLNAIQQYRLRSAASEVSGLAQKTRMMAVAQNRQYEVRWLTDVNAISYAYVDLNGNSNKDANENVNSLQLPRGVVFDTSGSAPSLASMGLGFTPVTPPRLPIFTPRGIPCVMVSLVCRTDTGQWYVHYLRQDRSFGNTGWAAVTVSPAGRVRVWVWTGSVWQ